MKKRVTLIQSRKKIGLTQKKLAEMIGISRAYLSHIENGVHDPSLQVAATLAKALDEDLNVFFCDDSAINAL